MREGEESKKQGLPMGSEAWGIFPREARPPDPVFALAQAVEDDGGAALAIYQEPVGEGWQLFALLAPVIPVGGPVLPGCLADGDHRVDEAVELLDDLPQTLGVGGREVALVGGGVQANAKGTWGFGCFVTGHYESGTKGTLVIE